MTGMTCCSEADRGSCVGWRPHCNVSGNLSLMKHRSHARGANTWGVLCAAYRRSNPARLQQGLGVGGRTWEAKHGEITSLPVSRSLKLHRILQCWNITTSSYKFGRWITKPTLNFIESRAPVYKYYGGWREHSACLPGCQRLPVFSPEGWQC